jgi:hypothetical protein
MTELEKREKILALNLETASLRTKLEQMEDEYRALEATPVTTHKVWEPGLKELYFDSAMLREFDNVSDKMDRPVIEAGLSHPTKEAAERHHAFLVMLHDLHKFAVEENAGWKPDWENRDEYKYNIGLDNGKLITTTWYSGWNQITPYFKSKELAQKAIDTFGDRLKILFEYYNS